MRIEKRWSASTALEVDEKRRQTYCFLFLLGGWRADGVAIRFDEVSSFADVGFGESAVEEKSKRSDLVEARERRGDELGFEILLLSFEGLDLGVQLGEKKETKVGQDRLREAYSSRNDGRAHHLDLVPEANISISERC